MAAKVIGDCLNDQQKEMLDARFNDIITRAAVDYTNPEFQDVQQAVVMMLEKTIKRINSRGVFTITHLQPCGSMAEKIAMWKTDHKTGQVYTEFDFLTVLKDVGNIICKQGCSECFVVDNPPVNLERLEQLYNRRLTEFISSSGNNPDVLYNIFLQEFTTCMVLWCSCFSVDYSRAVPYREQINKIRFKPTSKDKRFGCDNCAVDLPTGRLQINPYISIERTPLRRTAAKCSLVLLWRSKSTGLCSRDSSPLPKLQQPVKLPIYIDCLPVLEVNDTSPLPFVATKRRSSRDCRIFIVPTSCGLCEKDGWRRSCCLAEMNLIVNKMSERHRNSYQVMKYLNQSVTAIYDNNSCINDYHFKTVALHHSMTCPQSSESYAECVLKMYNELRSAYLSKELISFHSRVNFLHVYRKFHLTVDQAATVLSDFIEKLCSVSDADSLETFVQSIQGPQKP